MRFLGLFSIMIFCLYSCNLVEYQHKSQIKSLERKGIMENYFKSDSSNIHYYSGGKGPALLFLHGFGGDAKLSWSKYLKKFSKTHTVIAPDILWFGQSNSSLEANLQNQGKAIIQLINYLELDSIVVIGQSYGGFITMEMKIQDPELIKSMIIVNSPGPTFETTQIEKLCSDYEVESATDLFAFSDSKGLMRLLDISYRSPPFVPKAMHADILKKYFTPNQSQKTILIESLNKESERHLTYYRKTKCHSYIIWSDSDLIFPISEGWKLADLLNSKMDVVKKAGHISILKKTKQGIKLISEYLISL